MLVVIVIAGIILGMVSFTAVQSEQQALQNDAQRIALLMQLARDEAIVRNRPIAFESDGQHYRFLARDENGWNMIGGDEMLRDREFKHAPVALSLSPASMMDKDGPLRIVFGREPVDRPFLLTLRAGDAHVSIRADGIGHFVVE
jgi:general secretion pathway protein H